MEKEDDNMIYFTSDLHLGHRGIIEMQNRPFENIQEMNQVLIRNYNAVVHKNDTVYILGDISHHLNRLVTMFIDYAELMAEDEVLMSMQDWVEQTNQFLRNNRREVLEGKGKVSHDMAMKKAEKEYEIFRVKQDQEYVSEFDREVERYLKGE